MLVSVLGEKGEGAKFSSGAEGESSEGVEEEGEDFRGPVRVSQKDMMVMWFMMEVRRLMDEIFGAGPSVQDGGG